MRIAGVQMDFQLADVAGNLARMIAKVRQTRAAGADLAIFPECALTGYCFSSIDEARPYAESIPGPSVLAMSAICAELGGYVVFGMLECDGNKVFNALALETVSVDCVGLRHWSVLSQVKTCAPLPPSRSAVISAGSPWPINL